MGRPSRAKAIAAKCKDCIYDPMDAGTWRQQVEACTSQDCALWPVRPLSAAVIRPVSGEPSKDGKEAA